MAPQDKNQIDSDIVIVGGGLSGLTLACILGEAGLNVTCLDAAPPFKKTAVTDLRTTAVSAGSRKVLARAGIWADLEPLACPITDIEILDGSSPVLLEFGSHEVGGRPFGWILENADMRMALQHRATNIKTLHYVPDCPLKEIDVAADHVDIAAGQNRRFTAKLLVGADGRGSTVRNMLDIPDRGWTYNQRAVICTVVHEHPHHNVAVEHFHPQGPFAVLPMSDDQNGRHRSSVVFTEHGPQRRSLMRMDDNTFTAALAARFPARYGTIEMIGRRAAYPLSLVHASRYTAPRTALIADAAHGIHPIAGQGLNLGFRDVNALADLVADHAEDPGQPAMLKAYERARRFDNTSMAAVTDGLVKLFSTGLWPLKLSRRIGLRGVAALPPAKRFFMKQAMGE